MSARTWLGTTVVLSGFSSAWSGVAVGFFLAGMFDDAERAGWAAAFVAILLVAFAFAAGAKATSGVPS